MIAMEFMEHNFLMLKRMVPDCGFFSFCDLSWDDAEVAGLKACFALN